MVDREKTASGDYVYRLCRRRDGLHALFCSDIELLAADRDDCFLGKLVYVESSPLTTSPLFQQKTIWGIDFVEATKDTAGCYLVDTSIARLAELAVPEVLTRNHTLLRTWSCVRRDSVEREITSLELRNAYRSIGGDINALIDTIASTTGVLVGLVGSTGLQTRQNPNDVDIVLLPDTVASGKAAVRAILTRFPDSQSAYLQHIWPLSFSIAGKHVDVFICPAQVPSRLEGALSSGIVEATAEEFDATVVDDSNNQIGLSEWLLSDGTQLLSSDSAMRGRYPTGTHLVGLARRCQMVSGHTVRVLESFGNVAAIVHS